MPLGAREVLILFRAKDQASRVISGIGASFGSLEGESQKAAQKMVGMGTALMGAGIAVGAIGAIGVKWMYDATQAAQTYNNQAALTLTQADQTKVKFKDVYNIGLKIAQEFPVAFDSVQKALYDIFSSMDVNVPQAQMLLRGFAQAATAGGTDIQTAGRATIAILNAFHLPVSDLNNVLDIQFQLVRKGVGTYGEFATTIGRAIPSTVRAGQNVNTLAAMLAFLTRNGLSAAMASSSAARALDAISNPITVGRLEDMGVKVKNIHGEFRPLVDILGQMNDKFKSLTGPERAKALQDLFKGAGGTIQARRFFDPVFKHFDSFTARWKDMQKVGGTTMQALATMMDQPAAKAQILANKYQALRVQIGSQLLPVKVALMNVLSKILGYWEKLSPSVQRVIVWVVAISSALLLLTGIVLVIAGAVLTFMGILAMLGVGLGTVAAVVAIATGVFIAIVAIIIVVIKYHKQLAEAAKAAWKWIKDEAVKAWQAMQPILLAIGRFFTQTLPAAFKTFMNAMKQTWSNVKSWVNDAWQFIDPILQSFGDWFNTWVVPVLQAFGDLVAAVFNRVVQAFHFLQNQFDFYTKVFQKAFAGFRIIVTTEIKILLLVWQTTWNIMWQFLRVVWTIIVGVVKTALAVIKAAWKPFWDLLFTIVQVAWNSIKNIVESALKIIKGIIEIATGIISLNWSEVWQGMSDVFSGIWHFMVGILRNMWTLIRAAFKDGTTFISNIMKTVPKIILGALGDVGKMLYNAGIQIMKGLLNGITKGLQDVKSFVGKIGGWLTSWKGPPAKDAILLQNNGQLIMQGFQKGLTDGWMKVQKQVRGYNTHMQGSFTTGGGAAGLGGGSYPVGVGGSSKVVNVHPGAVQLTVQGNVDSKTLPDVQRMLDETIEELTRVLK